MRRPGERPERELFLISTVVAVGVLAAPPAAAIEFRAEQHVVVASDEVIVDDLYAAGETVTIDGRVEGDVIASGREVRMNGEVSGDFLACGQAVVVGGRVGDDVRMAGMALQLGPAAAVADDVVSAGLSLETDPESVAGGSLLFAGLQALLAGEIGERLLGSMDAVEIRGRIGGESDIEVQGDPGAPPFAQYIPSPVPLPAVAGGLTIADTARIDGRLEYTSRFEARGGGAGSSALTRRTPAAAEAEDVRKPSWPGRLLTWLGLLILGLLLVRLVPGWLDARAREILSRPLPLAGLGLLGVVALPVGLLVALGMVVVVAILLGLVKLGNLAALALVTGLVAVAVLVFAFWLTSSYLAPLLVGVCTGRLLLGGVAADKVKALALPLLIGLVLLAILRFVPILGFLVALAVLLLGWGALLRWLWTRLRAAPAAAA